MSRCDGWLHASVVWTDGIYSDRFTSLRESRDVTYLKPDLLIVDDVGMKQLRRRSGEVLFEIIMRRYETPSTMMTSNRPLEDWEKLIGDVPSAPAILDRFLHHAEVLTFAGKSYRLRKQMDGSSPEPAKCAALCRPAPRLWTSRPPVAPHEKIESWKPPRLVNRNDSEDLSPITPTGLSRRIAAHFGAPIDSGFDATGRAYTTCTPPHFQGTAECPAGWCRDCTGLIWDAMVCKTNRHQRRSWQAPGGSPS